MRLELHDELLHARPMTNVMGLRFLTMLFLAGCTSVQALQTPAERNLNSCFFSDERKGWLPLEKQPENAAELKALVASQWPKAGVLDDRYAQIWFSHTDGRELLCSLLPVGNLPAACGSMKFEFTPTSDGWSVKEGDFIMCHERVR
jgi:hypothetical protein